MSDEHRLARLLEDCAAQDVPDTLNLWPAVRDRLPSARPAQTRQRGLLTLAAAALIVVLFGGLVIVMLEQGSRPAPYASALQATATPTPTPISPPGVTPVPSLPATPFNIGIAVLTFDSDSTAQEVQLDRQLPQYSFRYRADSGDVMRLEVEVIQSSGSAPYLTLTHDGGDGIATFNPASTSRLSVEFTVPDGDLDVRQINLLGGPADSQWTGEITLGISLHSLAGAQEAAGVPLDAVLPPGMVAITVSVGAADSALLGSSIREGDRVDVISAFLFAQLDDPAFQSLELDVPAASGAEHQLVIQRVVQGATVLRIGPLNLPGGTPSPTPESGTQPTLVTLAVSPQDATVLTWIMESRLPVTLALSGE